LPLIQKDEYDDENVNEVSKNDEEQDDD